MTYKFKVKRITLENKLDETGEIVGPSAFSMAYEQANFWAAKLENKKVILLRADCEGINRDKFFLHQIIK